MSFINVFETVYENVLKMTKYRDIILESTPEKDIASILASSKYSTLTGTNRHKEPVIIILVGNNDSSTKVDSFRTMLKNVYAEYKKSHKDHKDTDKIEFIVIGPSISKTIQKQISINSKKSKSKHDTIMETYKNAYISLYTYTTFKIELPLGPNCFPHVILSPEEKEEFLKQERLDVTNMPKILVSDPQCIWIGARKGDIVKILRRNPLSITEIYYRYVK